MLLLAAALRPTSAELVDVVVAATDVPPGATLTAQDLSVASLPSDYLPPGAVLTVDGALGRTIVGEIAAGEPLTQSRLMATGPRADGLHSVPVRLADAEAATLLSPGSVIDLVLASRDSTPRVIAEGVQVVTIPQRPTSTGLGGTSRTAGSLIVVATDRRTAVALAGAGAEPGLGVVLR